MIDIPISNNIGILSVKLCKICGSIYLTVLRICGMLLEIPWINDITISEPFPLILGSKSFNKEGNFEINLGINLVITFHTFWTAILTLGPIFLATVSTESTNWSVRLSKLASSLLMPVSKFVQALFIELIEPSIVVAASFAVVPEISRLFCITDIAFIIFPNSKEPSSTVTFKSFWISVILAASVISLSISDFVPPYPSFKLSSIV